MFSACRGERDKICLSCTRFFLHVKGFEPTGYVPPVAKDGFCKYELNEAKEVEHLILNDEEFKKKYFYQE